MCRPYFSHTALAPRVDRQCNFSLNPVRTFFLSLIPHVYFNHQQQSRTPCGPRNTSPNVKTLDSVVVLFDDSRHQQQQVLQSSATNIPPGEAFLSSHPSSSTGTATGASGQQPHQRRPQPASIVTSTSIRPVHPAVLKQQQHVNSPTVPIVSPANSRGGAGGGGGSSGHPNPNNNNHNSGATSVAGDMGSSSVLEARQMRYHDLLERYIGNQQGGGGTNAAFNGSMGSHPLLARSGSMAGSQAGAGREPSLALGQTVGSGVYSSPHGSALGAVLTRPPTQALFEVPLATPLSVTTTTITTHCLMMTSHNLVEACRPARLHPCTPSPSLSCPWHPYP